MKKILLLLVMIAFVGLSNDVMAQEASKEATKKSCCASKAAKASCAKDAKSQKVSIKTEAKKDAKATKITLKKSNKKANCSKDAKAAGCCAKKGAKVTQTSSEKKTVKKAKAEVMLTSDESPKEVNSRTIKRKRASSQNQ